MLNNKKFYLIAVDMGYGHQRAAFPLAASAQGGVINANNYPGITSQEKKLWQSQRGVYEWLSYFKKIPLLGEAFFSAMDQLQDIADFYPKRPLPEHSLQQSFFYNKVKHGLGKQLIKQLNQKPLPLLSTFFVPIYFAEYYGYKGPLFCQVCDADINRAWAPFTPAQSQTIYFATTERAKERLIMYGVKSRNIIVTGFPLPKSNVGDNKKILKADLLKRLGRLDPSGVFSSKYGHLIKEELGAEPRSGGRPTLVFAIGGAGAQRELAADFLPALKPLLNSQKLQIILVAGSRPEVRDYFIALLKTLNIKQGCTILYGTSKEEYFRIFNQVLRQADILMTKPSELSFYAGLGLPLLLTPIVGAQERENRRWLLSLGAGLDAEALPHINDWLTDWLNDGRLARAAWQGYLEVENQATYNIEKIINQHK